MRFASLGSGSRGNGTLVQVGTDCVLVDCGFTIKETERRMALLDVLPEQLSAIVVTHEHGDHLKGVAPFARKHNVPVYMTPGTYHSKDLGKIPTLHLIENYQPFNIGNISFIPVAVPHDAREPAQFVLEAHGQRLGILTDLGNISAHVQESYRDCDAMVLEANHDSMMLSMGPYPASLKDRVGGPWGHLNNQQAYRFLNDQDLSRLQLLVIAHISEKNNDLEKVQEIFSPFSDQLDNLHYASQDQGFDWLEIPEAAIA